MERAPPRYRIRKEEELKMTAGHRDRILTTIREFNSEHKGDIDHE